MPDSYKNQKYGSIEIWLYYVTDGFIVLQMLTDMTQMKAISCQW